MKRILALVAVAGVAAASQGQTAFADLQFSTDAGTTWGDLVNANPGQTVLARVTVFTTGTSAAPFFAFGGAQFSQFNVAGSNAGDSVGTFAGLLNPSSQTFSLFNAGTGTAKIDRVDNPAGSIQLGQLGLDNGGSAANPITALTFNYTVSNAAGLGDIVVSLPANGYSLATYYRNSTSGNQLVPTGGRSFNGGTIRVVPAPGALALVGAGALIAGRRRRA